MAEVSGIKARMPLMGKRRAKGLRVLRTGFKFNKQRKPVPKRKQSKRRSANRRAANAFKAPEFAKDPTDGTAFRPHRVNPKNGMYRGRQVLNVEV